MRLALDAGRREPAFHLLTGSIVLLLFTDFAYGLLTLHGLYDHQLWLDAGWIGSYLLWGAAGLHPSMARLDQPVPGREIVLTRFRLGLLTCASLVAPVIGIIHDLRVGDLDYTVVRAASIMLFGLVVVRMAGLVRQQDRSLERERLLSGAGAELVAATEREEIDRVAVRGRRGACHARRRRRAVPHRRGPERLRVAAVGRHWAARPAARSSPPGALDGRADGEAVITARRRARRSPPGCRATHTQRAASSRSRRGAPESAVLLVARRGQRLQGRARRACGRSRPRSRSPSTAPC